MRRALEDHKAIGGKMSTNIRCDCECVEIFRMSSVRFQWKRCFRILVIDSSSSEFHVNARKISTNTKTESHIHNIDICMNEMMAIFSLSISQDVAGNVIKWKIRHTAAD